MLALINPLVENVWISHYLFQNLIFFALGTFYISKIYPMKNRSVFLTGLLFVFFEALYFLNAYRNTILKSYIVILCGLTGVIFVTKLFSLFFDRDEKKIQSFFSFNGVHSMEIYCTHPIIAAAIRIVISKIFVLAHFDCGISIEMLLTIALTIVIADSISFLLKSFKSYGWLFGVYQEG